MGNNEVADALIATGKWEDLFDTFCANMKEKYRKKIEKKGHTWIVPEDKRAEMKEYLNNELDDHLQKMDWVDVANYCLMLKYGGFY